MTGSRPAPITNLAIKKVFQGESDHAGKPCVSYQPVLSGGLYLPMCKPTIKRSGEKPHSASVVPLPITIPTGFRMEWLH